MEKKRSAEIRNAALPFAVAATAAALMAIVLHLQGRFWWCKYGDAAIYVPEAWNSPHTSQHLFDPYTFTHILHGVLFFWILRAALPNLSWAWQLLIATVVECSWEILENSTWVIEKYRENTASLDYFGDSIANSLGDVAACAVGFLIAFKLGRWWSLAFFLAVEIFLLWWIRDGLLLNIIMLIWPMDGVKHWQMGV